MTRVYDSVTWKHTVGRSHPSLLWLLFKEEITGIAINTGDRQKHFQYSINDKNNKFIQLLPSSDDVMAVYVVAHARPALYGWYERTTALLYGNTVWRWWYDDDQTGLLCIVAFFLGMC